MDTQPTFSLYPAPIFWEYIASVFVETYRVVHQHRKIGYLQRWSSFKIPCPWNLIFDKDCFIKDCGETYSLDDLEDLRWLDMMEDSDYDPWNGLHRLLEIIDERAYIEGFILLTRRWSESATLENFHCLQELFRIFDNHASAGLLKSFPKRWTGIWSTLEYSFPDKVKEIIVCLNEAGNILHQQHDGLLFQKISLPDIQNILTIETFPISSLHEVLHLDPVDSSETIQIALGKEQNILMIIEDYQQYLQEQLASSQIQKNAIQALDTLAMYIHLSSIDCMKMVQITSSRNLTCCGSSQELILLGTEAFVLQRYSWC